MDDKTVRMGLQSFQKRLERDKYFHPCFVVIEGARLGEKLSITQNRAVIGRLSVCEIPLEDSLVSKNHAEVILQPGNNVLIRDLGSTNGLYLNEAQVAEAVLKDGDLIRLGKTILKFIGPGSIENRYLSELSDKARLDGLTGIFNKQVFQDYLSREFKRCRLLNEPLTLMMMDIDFFKKVNDQMGHQAGDYTLKEFATLLNKTFRQSDLFARYGGEEFSLILPHTDLKEASIVAERIRSTVEKHQMNFQNFAFFITVSIGIGELNQKIEDSSQLVAAADAALYRAKHLGRNRVAK